MKIGGFHKVSLVDFPGRISSLVFTQGCNFRCPYCHNPELVRRDLFVPPLPEDEIFSFMADRRKYFQSLTVTGGEPTVQPDLCSFLERAKAAGLDVKLDTNGSRPRRLREIFDRHLVDFVAMDLKGPPERYAGFAGVAVNTRTIIEAVRLIMQSGVVHEFRTTVVASLFADGDFRIMGELVRGAKRFVLQSFIAGKTLDDGLSREKSCPRERLEKFRVIMKEYVEECIIR